MKIIELFESEINWEVVLKDTMKKLNSLFGEEVKFGGGYCFHLALALFLQGKKAGRKVRIIADGGHAVLLDEDQYISIDWRGIHNEESALNNRPMKSWSTSRGFIKAVKLGLASQKQIERLELVNKEYENI